jgi:hypothetical protein
MHLLFPNLTWLISSPVLDTRCSTCSSLLFKSPNLQNFPSPSKAYPVKRQIPKNIWPSLEFKQQQPLPQISSVAAGTTFYRFGHKRLKNFLRTTDSEMRKLCWISRPYSPFLLFPPWLRRLRAISPSPPDLFRGSHQATTRCVLLLRPARQPQTRASGNQNGHL